MGTVVRFKPDMDYYYARGLTQYESENFIDALKNYREAYKFADNPEEKDFQAIIEVEMASCYRHLHLTRETQTLYYKSLTNKIPDVAFDSVIGLIEIFGANGNDEALKYYMDLAAKKGFSREMDFIDAATHFYAQREYRVEPPPEQNMLDLGRKLLEAGQYEFARQLLEVIPPDSSVYPQACTRLATLCNASGDYEKALEYVKKADPADAETMVNTVLALYKAGRTDEYEEAVEELARAETDDVTALGQFIRVSAIVGRGDLVIKFGRLLIRVSPVRTPMLCYAVALSNAGELREAHKVMVALQSLYPYDAVIRVYSSLIAALTAPADFSLTCELPNNAESDILSELNGVLAECGTDRALLRSRLRNEKLRTGILMVFQAGSDSSKRILADIVADIPYFERYIRHCLIDPGFPDADKRILLPVALKRLKKRPVYLTCRDICRALYGKAPARIGSRWSDAYYIAYSAIALFGCENFEREFDAVFENLHASLEGENNVDSVAVAAVLARNVKKVSALRDDECCIELFGANRENYFSYLDKVKPKRTR